MWTLENPGLRPRSKEPELNPGHDARQLVLDVGHFPEIRVQSTSVEPKGPGHWIVHGNLALHGADRPIAVEVTLKGERYQGSASLKQTDFGITPVTVAGGTVKVKDEVKIEFEIALLK